MVKANKCAVDRLTEGLMVAADVAVDAGRPTPTSEYDRPTFIAHYLLTYLLCRIIDSVSDILDFNSKLVSKPFHSYYNVEQDVTSTFY